MALEKEGKVPGELSRGGRVGEGNYPERVSVCWQRDGEGQGWGVNERGKSSSFVKGKRKDALTK